MRSGLRSCSNSLVRLPPAAHRPPDREPDHRRARPDGSARLCLDQSLRLSKQHGLHGRIESRREAAEHLLSGAGKELDAVACGAGGQFQICATATSSIGGELCQFGVELLSELGQ